MYISSTVIIHRNIKSAWGKIWCWIIFPIIVKNVYIRICTGYVSLTFSWPTLKRLEDFQWDNIRCFFLLHDFNLLVYLYTDIANHFLLEIMWFNQPYNIRTLFKNSLKFFRCVENKANSFKKQITFFVVKIFIIYCISNDLHNSFFGGKTNKYKKMIIK